MRSALLIIALLAQPISATAHTWYVTEAGAGDAPTISAAMDSASYADTVLVGPGVYEIDMIAVTDGVVFRAAESPAGVTVSRCLFTDNAIGIYIAESYVSVLNNTFVDNQMAISLFGSGFCAENIIWDDTENLDGFSFIVCNDLLDITDILEWRRPDNFSLDSQFCDPATADLRLQATSPCAPDNSPPIVCRRLIGALPVMCGAGSVEERSWGNIKSRYHIR